VANLRDVETLGSELEVKRLSEESVSTSLRLATKLLKEV
jgi:hypothetical protein